MSVMYSWMSGWSKSSTSNSSPNKAELENVESDHVQTEDGKISTLTIETTALKATAGEEAMTSSDHHQNGQTSLATSERIIEGERGETKRSSSNMLSSLLKLNSLSLPGRSPPSISDKDAVLTMDASSKPAKVDTVIGEKKLAGSKEAGYIESDASSSSKTPRQSRPILALPVTPPSTPSLSAVTTPTTNNYLLPPFPLPPSVGQISFKKDHSSSSLPSSFNKWLLKLFGIKSEGSLKWNRPLSISNDSVSNSPLRETKPKIPKIGVIGIHGWYPTKFIQRVVGLPSSSDKFVQKMVSSLQSHYQDQDDPSNSLDPSHILQIPLEGEGKILDRVEQFYQKIKNMMNTESSVISDANNLSKAPKNLNECDHIYIVAHSQGAPVAILLLHQLLANGLLNYRPNDSLHTGPSRITLLAIAGILHGPFPELGKGLIIQYIEAESSRELFELNETLLNDEIEEFVWEFRESTTSSAKATLEGSSYNSQTSSPPTTVPSTPLKEPSLSTKVRNALIRLMKMDVRVVAVGSWMDQVVPLYSATMHGFMHPNLLRSVYIDEHLYRPDFLTSLVTFTLSLRNAGLGDFGLLLYLSEFIAGSWMKDVSHSTVYDEEKVYKMAINWGVNSSSIYPLADMRLFDQKLNRKNSKCPFNGPIYVPFNVPSTTGSGGGINYYYLPWILHSLWTDPILRSHPHFSAELDNLRELYLRWTPTTKILKDLKWKLEPLSTLTMEPSSRSSDTEHSKFSFIKNAKL